jgi:hypothetical protein
MWQGETQEEYLPHLIDGRCKSEAKSFYCNRLTSFYSRSAEREVHFYFIAIITTTSYHREEKVLCKNTHCISLRTYLTETTMPETVLPQSIPTTGTGVRLKLGQ